MLFEAWLEDRLANPGLSAFNPLLTSHNTLLLFVFCSKWLPPRRSHASRESIIRSPSEINILIEKVEENLEVLQSKLTNSVTKMNKRKKQIWDNITAAVNAVGFEKRDVTEVREKWKNIH